jgi:chemotaxis protein methyltransferase CheR
MKDVRPAYARISDEQFDFLTKYLASKYGLRIPPEKRILLETRLISRINSLKMDSMQEYIKYAFHASHVHDEYQLFVDHITTHKTFFFRENYQFEYLKKMLPDYFAKVKSSRPLTTWSAGCSTGEEVYTLAMVLNESRSRIPLMDYRIIGTDISVPSLRKAAQGIFSVNELDNIPENLGNKYFNVTGNVQNQVLHFNNEEVKRKINLGVLNLNNKQYNVPMFDFIFCRNVTIYFDTQTRNKVVERIVERLRPGGFLFLGHSETALGMTLPLKSIQPTIYQKLNS